MLRESTGVFERSLASDLAKVLTPGKALPNRCLCSQCDRLDLGQAEVKERLGERPDVRLVCRCAEVARVADRERWAAANVPRRGAKVRTFENFAPRPGTGNMVRAAREFSRPKGASRIHAHALVLTGEKGCGKSHMLQAIARKCLEDGQDVRYELVSSMLDRLRSCFDTNTKEDFHELLTWYEQVDLLLLDDLGMERQTDWGREKVQAIFDERINAGRRLVIATNATKREMEATMGPRLASRLLAENPDFTDVRCVPCTATDYRAQTAKRGRHATR